MEKIINEIMSKKIGDIIVDAKLSKFTTYKVGGTAKLLVYPKTIDKLVELMEIILREDIKYFILGNGSNVLFSDKVYDGIIIKLDYFDEIEINDNLVRVGAGYNLIKLANEVAVEVRKFFKERVYNVSIPRNIKLSEAQSKGKPIVNYDKNSTGAKAYSELAKEMLANEKTRK